jgi:hypothetical protein
MHFSTNKNVSKAQQLCIYVHTRRKLLAVVAAADGQDTDATSCRLKWCTEMTRTIFYPHVRVQLVILSGAFQATVLCIF